MLLAVLAENVPLLSSLCLQHLLVLDVVMEKFSQYSDFFSSHFKKENHSFFFKHSIAVSIKLSWREKKRWSGKAEGDFTFISKLTGPTDPFAIQIPCWLNSDAKSHQGELEIGS